MGPTLFHDKVFTDVRGKLFYNNELDMTGIKRSYLIEVPETNIVRAWQAHRFEKKWFPVTKGRFIIKLIKIDDWKDPSLDLNILEYKLDSQISETLYVPEGYATGIKAQKDGSKIMVFSSFTLEESINDDFRFPAEYRGIGNKQVAD